MKENNQSNKILKSMVTFLTTAFIVCLIFFTNITTVSAKTSQSKAAQKYTLTLQERGGYQEVIRGADINLKYDTTADDGVSYDDALLQAKINNLSCFSSGKVIKSQNAKLVYENNSYVIYKEVYGDQVNREVLYKNIVQAIKNKTSEINLEKMKCYEEPQILSNSPEMLLAKNTIDKYMSSKITYIFAGQTQFLDSSSIKDWINIDGCQVSINEALVKNYVTKLADTYTSLLGTSIKVRGGYSGNNHSWVINTEAETNALMENIKNGQTITKHPIYAQTAVASYFSNVGDTYVEVDMTKQHLWYYKDGYLVVEGDVVTGNASVGHSTPAGVYHLYYKQKDTILKGEDYAAPVSFWMPFNKDIGLHDATWRTEFGGNIYKTDGSHGCVNAPYYVAKTVYDNISPGVVVICYNS